MSELLEQWVEDAFGPRGYFVRKHQFRFEAAQLEYAHRVVDWLQGEGELPPLSLLEGETGLGKSLAYLVPVCLVLATNPGQRACVATHTVYLQRQLLDGDLKLVAEYLNSLKLPMPSVAQVLGKRHFVDPLRVDNCLATLALELDLDEDHHALRAWADDVREEDADHRGLIEDFVRDYGGLPKAVRAEDICILDGDEHGNVQFVQHRIECQYASLVITSHSVLLLNLLHKRSLLAAEGYPLTHLCVDEADALEAAAQSIFNLHLQPRRISQQLKAHDDIQTGASSKLARHLATLATALDTDLVNYGRTHGNHAVLYDQSKVNGFRAKVLSQATELREALQGYLGFMHKSRAASSQTPRARTHLQEMERYAQGLDKFCSSGAQQAHRGIFFSPKWTIPSIGVQVLDPAQIVRTYWRSATHTRCRTLFTSATLSDGARQDHGDRFRSTRSALGILPDDTVITARLAPRQFGSLQFVLTAPDTPSPIEFVDGDNAVTFHHDWLTRVTAMMHGAAEAGNTLVLCSSFREAKMLARRLDLEHVILHAAGESLSDCLARFRRRGGVLISPGMWEGVSLRCDDGSQAFDQLLITRIPFAPPDTVYDQAVAASMRERGCGQSLIDGVLRNRANVKAVRKLRQGIGRLLRRFDDSGTLWIADPRFPLPPAAGLTQQRPAKALRGAISERFDDAFSSATIFYPAGEGATQNTGTNSALSAQEVDWL